MRLFTGQPEAIPAMSLPVWQNGMPQSMQRAPCARRVSSAYGGCVSLQSLMRSSGGRSCFGSRGYSMNPVGLPMLFP